MSFCSEFFAKISYLTLNTCRSFLTAGSWLMFNGPENKKKMFTNYLSLRIFSHKNFIFGKITVVVL